MPLPPAIARVGDWILRTKALREARARAGNPTGSYGRAADQVKMLVEVARRVAEPVEALPAGSRPAVLLSLYRDAAYWALAAEQARRGGATPADDLGVLWSGTEPTLLQKAAGDETRLAAVRASLERPRAESLDATEADVAAARSFVENLLWELDTPARAIECLQVQRWTRLAAVAVIVLAAAFGLRYALRGPNLVRARVFKTSTALPECTAPNKCVDVFFHTQAQNEPWIDFDLGGVKTISRVDVRNRTDCCSDRAVPLIVEVSQDDKTWVQVARRDTDFSEWSATFPKQKARHVRLRVPRTTTLHLEDVSVR